MLGREFEALCGELGTIPLSRRRFARHPLPAGERGNQLARTGVDTMSISDSIRSQLVPIHPQGYPFIGGFALASLILFWLWTPLGWIGTLATAWCAYFFRDPTRVTPVDDAVAVSPADGRVSAVSLDVPPAELGLGGEARRRISIFMSIFDCHVNRSRQSPAG